VGLIHRLECVEIARGIDIELAPQPGDLAIRPVFAENVVVPHHDGGPATMRKQRLPQGGVLNVTQMARIILPPANLPAQREGQERGEQGSRQPPHLPARCDGGRGGSMTGSGSGSSGSGSGMASGSSASR
jgi:hypothetical protein